MTINAQSRIGHSRRKPSQQGKRTYSERLNTRSGESNLPRTLKISDETYHRLNRLAGEIRSTEGRPASMDAAISRLLDERRKASPLDFTGAWDMDDREAGEIIRALDEVWSTWRIES